MNNSIAVSVGHYRGEKEGDVEFSNSLAVANILVSLLSTNSIFSQIFEGHLEEKVKNVNLFKPDLALEIHFNAYDNNQGLYGTGIETLYCKGSVQGKIAAKIFSKSLYTYLPFGMRGHEGVQEREDLYFLKKTKAPAIIPEPLFYDNPLDSKFLKMPRGHQLIADALYGGCVSYLKLLSGSV